MMAVSNSCGTKTLKFDDVVSVLLSEGTCRKSSKSTETSESVMSVDRRGRSRNRDKKKNEVKIQIRERHIQVEGSEMLAIW